MTSVTETREITNSEDVIDVRDVIARFEELEAERESYCDGETAEEDADLLAEFDESEEGREYAQLKELLEELESSGGDEQWRGSWYPITLIRDSHFESYAQELADDIGAINSDATWPNNCIDWERAARELQIDYSTVEFGDVTYWYR